jgi:hypothetical protein
MSPNPSLINNRELGVMALADEPGKGPAPTVKVLGCMYAAVSRALRSERQNGLPGLGKIWKPTPVLRNRREVTCESVI